MLVIAKELEARAQKVADCLEADEVRSRYARLFSLYICLKDFVDTKISHSPDCAQYGAHPVAPFYCTCSLNYTKNMVMPSVDEMMKEIE